MDAVRVLFSVVEEMVRGFFIDLSSSSTDMWVPIPLHDDEDLKIMVKGASHQSVSPGRSTIMLSTSVGIPVPPIQGFDFPSDDESQLEVSTI